VATIPYKEALMPGKKKNGAKGPVAKVWEIATKMRNAPRKDVLAACEKAGINHHTARTQYQHWRHRNDAPKKKPAMVARKRKKARATKRTTKKAAAKKRTKS
jgi:hypothetical protein